MWGFRDHVDKPCVFRSGGCEHQSVKVTCTQSYESYWQHVRMHYMEEKEVSFKFLLCTKFHASKKKNAITML